MTGRRAGCLHDLRAPARSAGGAGAGSASQTRGNRPYLPDAPFANFADGVVSASMSPSANWIPSA